MAMYKVEITVTASNINSVRNIMAAAFPGEEVRCDRIDFNPSRTDRLEEAATMVESARLIVEELQQEMENWYDSIPDNLRSGEKANEVEEAKDALENLLSEVESLNFDDVNFPSMF